MNTINYIGCHYKESSSFIIQRETGSNDHLLLLFHTPVDMELDGNEIHCPSGTLMLYEKGYTQYYYNRKHGFVNDFVHFSNEHLRKLTDAFDMPLNKPLTITNTHSLHHHFLALEKEHLKENRGYEFICDMLITRILVEGLRSHYTSINHSIIYRHEEAIRDLRQTIMSELQVPWTIDTMCMHVDLSRSRFNTLYTQIFGITPKKDLQNMRIEHGRRLLTSTNLSISEVAQRVGYESIYHFSKQFKKVIGRSPRMFRQSNK